jgi:hypothetical protein
MLAIEFRPRTAASAGFRSTIAYRSAVAIAARFRFRVIGSRQR